MQMIDNSADKQCFRPWNKGKIIGQKPPLQPKHVWAVRTRLQLSNRKRDLALFNLAIDSKLRGCDLVSLQIGLEALAAVPHRGLDGFPAIGIELDARFPDWPPNWEAQVCKTSTASTGLFHAIGSRSRTSGTQ